MAFIQTASVSIFDGNASHRGRGKAVSDYFEAAIKTVYVKEIKAPDKYAQSDVIHKVDVEAGKTVTISATDERVKGAVHIQKIDKETQAFFPRGIVPLRAVYGLYAREDIVHRMERRGFLFKKDSLIAQGRDQGRMVP